MTAVATVSALIQVLEGINAGTVPFEVREVHRGTTYIECEQAEDLIYALLISGDGGCNWDNIEAVRKAGFHVYAGEKDSFGWLTGCVRTEKGIIVYG